MLNEIKKDIPIIKKYLIEEYDTKNGLKSGYRDLYLRNIYKIEKLYEKLENSSLSESLRKQLGTLIVEYYNTFLKLLPDKAFGGESTQMPIETIMKNYQNEDGSIDIPDMV